MMKKMFLPLMLLLSMFSASITSCSGDSDDDDDWNLTEDSLDIIFQNVEQVTQVAGDIFMQCETPAETEKYFDELRQTPNVDDIWTDNQTMFVKIHDFGIISYIFKPKDSAVPEDWIEAIKRPIRTRIDFTDSYDHIQLSPKRVCIINQESKDDSRQDRRDIAAFTEKMFKSYGFEVTLENAPSVEFFRNDIFDYDLIFIITHGSYVDGQHWLLTGEEHSTNNFGGIDWLKLKNRWNYSKKQISVGCVKETRGKVERNHYYTKVSETFFAKSDKSFPSGGNTIMFNVACKSLYGEDEDKKRTRNYNLADVFISKGLGAYLGYDETDGVGAWGGMNFFLNLVSGLNVGDSYYYLPDWIVYDDREEKNEKDNSVKAYTAYLMLKTSGKNLIENSCITHPEFDDKTDVLKTNSGKVTLKASQNLFLPDKFLSLKKNSDYGLYLEDNRYGFLLSETKFLKDAKELCKMKIGEKDCTHDGLRVSYNTTIPLSELKPETTYYYWAFFYDGYNYCYSDYKEFTTPEKSIDQVIPDKIRKTMEPYIPIYDGNNPPNIEGIYVIDPMEIVYDMTGTYQPGYNNFGTVYFEISNQNPSTNTLDYREQEVSYGVVGSESKGEGAFISGEGSNFSVYFNTTGVTHLDKYDVTTTHALVISGTKSNDGIRDLRYSFVMVSKGDDPDHQIMDEEDFRVFKDGDNWAERTNWSFTRAPQITVHDGQIITPWENSIKRK